MLEVIHRVVENAARLRVSQRELCARAGVNQSTVARWLNGGRLPGDAVLAAVARRLQEALDEILVEVEEVLREAQGARHLPAGAAGGGADGRREHGARAA